MSREKVLFFSIFPLQFKPDPVYNKCIIFVRFADKPALRPTGETEDA